MNPLNLIRSKQEPKPTAQPVDPVIAKLSDLQSRVEMYTASLAELQTAKANIEAQADFRIPKEERVRYAEICAGLQIALAIEPRVRGESFHGLQAGANQLSREVSRIGTLHSKIDELRCEKVTRSLPTGLAGVAVLPGSRTANLTDATAGVTPKAAIFLAETADGKAELANRPDIIGILAVVRISVDGTAPVSAYSERLRTLLNAHEKLAAEVARCEAVLEDLQEKRAA